LGAPYRRQPGIPVPYMAIPLLRDIPVIGKIFFQQDAFTYLSFIVIIAAWFWIFRTRAGLALRSVGERPQTAFARGVNVNRTRYLYTALGGALVGLGGAAFTLALNSTWDEQAIQGSGWIALAIVIFGGWHPARVAIGVYLVATLQSLPDKLQGIGVPAAILNAIPWLLMLATLLAVSGPYFEGLLKITSPRFHPLIRALLRSKPPAALGSVFEQEGR